MTMREDELKELYRQASLVHDAMVTYGGSFMRALAGAIEYADQFNLAKIRQTWKEEWDGYLRMKGGYK